MSLRDNKFVGRRTKFVNEFLNYLIYEKIGEDIQF